MEQALIAQINLSSILQVKKNSNIHLSAPQVNIDRSQSNTPDNVLGSLFQSGKVGDKSKRSQQNLKAIQKIDRVSIDENNLNILGD